MAYKRISPQPVDEGGTGASTLTDHGVLVGSGTSAITPLSAATNGQLLIGSTGADPSVAAPTSSDSLLTVTGGAGTLDLTANQAVAASSTLTDNLVIRGDGGSRGVQTSTISVTDNGEMTNTSQPAFLAHGAATFTNVTGDGTTVTVVFDNEAFDQNSDYDNTTGTFTAPVTGKYFLEGAIGWTGLTSSHTRQITRIVTSNGTYFVCFNNPFVVQDSNGFINAVGSALFDMDAADTATITGTVYNGSKVVDIDNARSTYFSGALIC